MTKYEKIKSISFLRVKYRCQLVIRLKVIKNIIRFFLYLYFLFFNAQTAIFAYLFYKMTFDIFSLKFFKLIAHFILFIFFIKLKIKITLRKLNICYI